MAWAREGYIRVLLYARMKWSNLLTLERIKRGCVQGQLSTVRNGSGEPQETRQQTLATRMVANGVGGKCLYGAWRTGQAASCSGETRASITVHPAESVLARRRPISRGTGEG